MTSSLLPALINREIIELDQLVDVCMKRYARRAELFGAGAEDILADSLATCLHSFYTGLERLFEVIVREVDGARSHPAEWHRELLMAVSVDRPGLRPAVLSERAFQRLDEYRSFRHLFRHLYTHHIDPGRIFGLMEVLGEAWSAVREDLVRFLAYLEPNDGGN